MDRDESELLRDSLASEDNEDDLEFHMTFPSPSQVDKFSDPGTPAGGQDFVFVRKDDPEPVIFMLGWAGCQDKHLAKYSKVYEDLGCITVRYTAPAEYIFFDPEKLRPLAKKLLDLVGEMSLESNPVFFHIFSNNGSAVYQYMSETLHRESEYRGIVAQIKGCIFDSAPGRRTASSFLRAASEVFGLVSGSQKTSLFCYDYVKNEDFLRVPMLFLFSANDDVIKAEDVEEVVAAREKQGCEVTRVCYDDSPHVQHLRHHRESYVSSICSFINKCLKESKSEKKEAVEEEERESDKE